MLWPVINLIKIARLLLIKRVLSPYYVTWSPSYLSRRYQNSYVASFRLSTRILRNHTLFFFFFFFSIETLIERKSINCKNLQRRKGGTEIIVQREGSIFQELNFDTIREIYHPYDNNKYFTSRSDLRGDW